MTPEEKLLLERSIKLSEDNNRILRKMERRFRWAVMWGVIKLVVLVIPLVIGFLYLEPYFNQLGDSYSNFRDLLNNVPF